MRQKTATRKKIKNIQRRFARFNVSHVPVISGQMGRFKDDKDLVTFGEGGCGFYGHAYPLNLETFKKVTCQFFLESDSEEPIQIEGQIVYVRPMQIGDKELFYYGVEFSDNQHHFIRPILEHLKKGE